MQKTQVWASFSTLSHALDGAQEDPILWRQSRLVVSLEQLARIGGFFVEDPGDADKLAGSCFQGIPTATALFDAHFLASLQVGVSVRSATAFISVPVAGILGLIPTAGPEFYSAFQKVLDPGTKPETQMIIKTPVIGLKEVRDSAAQGSESGLRTAGNCH